MPSVEPTADGWVNFTTNSAQQFADFAVLIGHPEIGEDERYVRATPRFEHRDEFWEMTRAYTRPRASATVLEEAGLLRIPVAPVLDGATVDQFEQFVARGVFVDHPSGRFRQPRIPFRLHDVAPRPFGPVPAPGEHDGAVEWAAPDREGAPGRRGRPSSRRPTGGRPHRMVGRPVRHAGPGLPRAQTSSRWSRSARPDLMRFAGTKAPGDPQWWEWGPLAHAANTNKRGITLDLTSAEGHELALRLCATADMVFENFTPAGHGAVRPGLGTGSTTSIPG